MKTATRNPAETYELEEETREPFYEENEPSFDQPYDWDELMGDVELGKVSREPGVGLEYIANAGDNGLTDQYLEDFRL